MAAPDGTTLVFDPPRSKSGVALPMTWSDAEALLAITVVGKLLLGPEWSEHLAEGNPGLHAAFATWTHGVTDPATTQPDRAVARVRFIEAARAALRRERRDEHGENA